MILIAVLVVVPRGRLAFPGLTDPDTVFLRVMDAGFPPLIRGLAVAAVIAAVMSTTDALLLACSSAIADDLLGRWIEGRLSPRAGGWITVAVSWAIGLLAMVLAWSPPPHHRVLLGRHRSALLRPAGAHPRRPLEGGQG